MKTTLRLLTLTLFTSSAFGLTDCKKSSEPAPKKPSEREVWLTTPGWKLERYDIVETTTAGVVTTTNYPLTFFDPCSLDDLEYYHADKSYKVDEGVVKCSDTYPQFLISAAWAFAPDETKIILKFGQPEASIESRIQTLTTTTLTLAEAPDTLSNGTRSVAIRTYSAH